MSNTWIPTLSEEQFAAYLDGMLDTEESSMVEQAIADAPALQEIEDAIDETDYSFIVQDPMEEIPLECLADDFQLPAIGYDDYNSDNSYTGNEVGNDITLEVYDEEVADDFHSDCDNESVDEGDYDDSDYSSMDMSI